MYKKYIKRLFDILLALIALPFFIIIFIIISPFIYFEDRGPIFYNAYRLGKHGKIFKMYKFRSMKVNVPDIRNNDGSTFNSKNDIRLTKIGKFIRQTSIDELPQILNVLKGDMSFVGPRPDLPDAIENLYDDVIKKKLKLRPGITGYSQAYYRNSSTIMQRFDGDLFYLKNLSFFLDFKILLKTIKIIILRESVYRNN